MLRVLFLLRFVVFTGMLLFIIMTLYFVPCNYQILSYSNRF